MTATSDRALDDEYPGSTPPQAVRLPGLTHPVVRTVHPREGKSFTKTYVCGSVEDAHRLFGQFERRSEFIHRINAEVRRPGADGPVLALAPYQDRSTEIGGTTQVRTAVETQQFPAEDLAREGPLDGSRVDAGQVVQVTAGWKTPVTWTSRRGIAEVGQELDKLRDVARALDVIHTDNGAHGDVKPANICKDENGYVLVDPDLLCFASRHDPEAWTVPPTAQESPAYVYPAAGQLGAGQLDDPRSLGDLKSNDVFGFVAILACVLLGEEQIRDLYTDPLRRQHLEHHIPAAIQANWSDDASAHKGKVAGDLLAGWLGHDRTWFAEADCEGLLDSLRDALKPKPGAVTLDPPRSDRADAVFRKVRQPSGQVHPIAVRGEVQQRALRLRRRLARRTFVVLVGVGVAVAALAVLAFMGS